ncbi:class IV lanthionine synthetase LanL [Planobispora siamensis]|uniref:non-specific serine/threonine protein kinase n=1 Tax=Planobispora siamensis TaxID=936338 RepID=A0A8J3SLM9_9ACTN|nr:class IV lanthionine synthetase LanL [Planobispora siamensis]GIH94836.1 serine/threonine protein kinase [Planobispora siamensis]
MDGSPLIDIVRAALSRADGARTWDIRTDEFWCFVTPDGHGARDQGWKLHVSATGGSAPAVLDRSAGVLAGRGCAFKFARTPEHVDLLGSRMFDRGGAGKFITAYPDDDDHFRELAAELDRATRGLQGPEILSDRPYRPGSLVHYRYGVFHGRRELTMDGDYRYLLVDPAGSPVEDRRNAWFSAPRWAPSPFPGYVAPEPRPERPPEVLLKGRYLARVAYRHTTKGGVFRGTDTRTGREVIIKQARPYLEASADGTDIRDRLRDEAAALDRLAPLGVVPGRIDLFEQEGHLFLVEELVSGRSLERWVGERPGSEPGPPWPMARALAGGLVRLVSAVHEAGLVLRDISPGNVMVSDDGRVRLVDLEFAVPAGRVVEVVGTPGYIAPECLGGPGPVAATPEADCYGLGALVFLVATGRKPVLPEDETYGRPARDVLEDWTTLAAEHGEAARRLAPLISGLMDGDPGRRWTALRAGAFVRRPGTPPPSRRSATDPGRLLADGTAYLLAQMRPDDPERLWPSGRFGESTDPCNVQHGAAGVVAVLARLTATDPALAGPLRTACGWMERRAAREPVTLPGLQFGRSGTVWALHEAARVLDDAGLAGRAAELAMGLPIAWPISDVCHGTAGSTLTHVRLWRDGGRRELRDRIDRCADGLVAAASRRDDGVFWPVPAELDSHFAGATHYGFAHGSAGVGYALLNAAQVTGRSDCLELARLAGDTLVAAAVREEGAAWWGQAPDDPGRLAYWCNGAAGAGLFLARLWRATGVERYGELAALAAVAVHRTRWHMTPSICHGLAGNGHFLLDMADLTGDGRYRRWADDLAVCMCLQYIVREGRLLIPDETGVAVVPDYGVGLSGALAFLHRLQYGGASPFMTD